MPNRLRESASPYLRQHADNPVDWYEWGPEALAKARLENRPILLSIGYAACHWCHVMAHESFEDPQTAALMNQWFVNIKVDREERPDLDQIYMQAVQALTGHGGWPMTVFLTPDGAPFYGGTYFPPEDRHGIPSFRRVLQAVANTWRDRPAEAAAAGRALTELIARTSAPPAASGSVGRDTLDRAFRALAQGFDARYGGFSGAPKFPPCMALDFLLRHWSRTGEPLALDIVRQSYLAMYRGGIHDQVGGGIHRYSVDERWLVPHFEKMLYDNALFARLGVRLWQATRDAEAREAAERTLQWVLREMTDDGGAFHASLDADSEGHEGRFYVWTREEIAATAGDDAAVALVHWNVSDTGNFEGRNILYAPHDIRATAARTGLDESQVAAALGRARRALYDVRSRRPWPGKDDKIVASWNGLMIRAFVEAARAFQRDDFLDAAVRASRFLDTHLVRDDRAARAALGGRISAAGVLEDQASLGLAFLDVYGATFDPWWLDRSAQLTRAAVAHYRDPDTGDWFDTANDAESLIVRPRDFTDNATPAGRSLVAELLLAWADLDDRSDWREAASAIVSSAAETLGRYPQALGHLAGVADTLVNGSTQLALVGDPASEPFRELAARAGGLFVPGLVLAGGPSGTLRPALLHGRSADGGLATAWVCHGFACDLPTSDGPAMERQLTARAGDGAAGPAPVQPV